MHFLTSCNQCFEWNVSWKVLEKAFKCLYEPCITNTPPLQPATLGHHSVAFIVYCSNFNSNHLIVIFLNSNPRWVTIHFPSRCLRVEAELA